MRDDPPKDDDDFEPISVPRSGKSFYSELKTGCEDEGDDIDLTLAFQTMSDFGNANRLISRFGKDLTFAENIGWFIWDGTRWNRNSGQAGAIRFGHKVGEAIFNEAKALQKKRGRTSDDRISKLFAWHSQSLNQARVHAMLSAASPYLTTAVDRLNADQFVVGATNSTIILKSQCDVREPNRADMITRVLGVKFREGATCPSFDKFLERIMPDPEMRAFLQRICGYCLTGSTREHKLFIFYGTGRNGKSTLINVLRHVMGDYAASTPAATFLSSNFSGSGSEASPDLARLPGVRMVTAAEPPEGARLDEARVKEMTGGDPMTVRHLNQGFFEFRPSFKAIISTNHQPTIRGTDRGIWSRINVLPFTVQILDDEIDPGLEEKLKAEGEGVLQWMLTGTEEWLSSGLRPPARAIAAVEDYRADQDPVGEFLKARCELLPLDYINPETERAWETPQKRLREVYVEWCKEEGLEPMTTSTFGKKLTGRGMQRRKSNGVTFYPGVTIKGDAVTKTDDLR